MAEQAARVVIEVSNSVGRYLSGLEEHYCGRRAMGDKPAAAWAEAAAVTGKAGLKKLPAGFDKRELIQHRIKEIKAEMAARTEISANFLIAETLRQYRKADAKGQTRTALTAIDQMSKLTGLEPPAKVAVTNTKGEDVADMEDVARRLAFLLGAAALKAKS